MPRLVILTRHAKSAWSDPTLDDYDRPLNDRGRRAAPAVAHWLAEGGWVPGEVLVSGARRTVETWSAMAPALPDAGPMRADRRLYEASSDILLAALGRARAEIVLLIAHNPGIGELARRLATPAPTHSQFDVYPTAATTVIEMTGVGRGRPMAFVVPRDLTD